MTIDRRIEAALPEILAELGAGPRPDYVALVLERSARSRQRPGWFVPARWVPERLVAAGIPGLRLRPVVALLLLALSVAATAVYVGSRPRLPAPFGPARNGSLVYGSDGDIFAGTPDGRSTAIVAGPEYDFGAFYSPDGTKFAFYRRADQTVGAATDMLVARADGSDVTRITPHPLEEIPWSASWMPDGSAIAVMTSQRADGRLEFYDATGVGRQRVIELGLRIDTFAFQPPAGRRILFSAQGEDGTGLYTMDRYGSRVTTLIAPYHSDQPQNTGGFWNITSDIRDLRNSIWSPDGRRIVFQQTVIAGDSRQMRLFMMDSYGTHIQPITFPDGDSIDAHPAWSPDGTRIAFLRYRLDLNAWTYAVVRLSDGVVTRTGPTIPDGMDPDSWSPGLATIAWSPDGTVLFAVERSGSQRAHILDFDGGESRELPWTIETPESWGLTGFMNGFDPGSWQRLASP